MNNEADIIRLNPPTKYVIVKSPVVSFNCARTKVKYIINQLIAYIMHSILLLLSIL